MKGDTDANDFLGKQYSKLSTMRPNGSIHLRQGFDGQGRIAPLAAIALATVAHHKRKIETRSS